MLLQFLCVNFFKLSLILLDLIVNILIPINTITYIYLKCLHIKVNVNFKDKFGYKIN